MHKLFFTFFLWTLIPLSSALSSPLVDIDDETRDKDITLHNLPKYITSIFNSRAEYLRERITNLEEESDGIFEVGEIDSGGNKVSVYLAAESSQTENSFKRCYIETYKDHLRFFADDPFSLPIEGGGIFKLDLLNEVNLHIYYTATVSSLLDTFKKSRETKTIISSMDFNKQIIMEPLIYQEENGMRDLVSIIRSVRPHVRKSKVMTKFLEEADQNLKFLVALDQAYQWRDISSKPWFQEALKQSEVASLSNSQNVGHKAIQDLPVPISSIPSTQTIAMETLPLPSRIQATSNIQTTAEETTLTQDGAKELTTLAPFPIKKVRKVKREKEIAPKTKLKTRPVNGLEHLQSLNGLFDEEPAAEKALRNLNPTFDASSSATHNLRILHASQRKVLEKLLHANVNAINVDKSLALLKSFGLINEPTSSQHWKLKAKTVELWLGGERTLIDLPVATLAVSHKGKRYFKPYIVNRIRKALLQAHFDKLLE
jgi:hypothetical protein